MNYLEEQKRLKENSDYWKPKAGQYKLKALTELEETNPFVKTHENGTEETSEQAKMKILIDNEEKVWTFGKGKTSASTYGQLIDLAIQNGNQLKDVEFSVVVKNDGKKNDYTIVK